MTMNKVITHTILFGLALSFTTDWSSEFDYETYIDENELFKLYWTDWPDDIIEFGIEVKATGWIALGISPRGQMPNSDIAIGWVNDNGKVYLQDRYTTDRTAPLYDSYQNLTLIEGEEANGMTRIRFKRPKYSCNPDDLSIGQGTTRLIWAFHATQDPEEECWDSSTITYHTNKGSRSINLESGVPEEIELESDVTTIDILNDNVSVPATDTTYWCKLFKLPVFNDTQHIVKFEPLIQDGHDGIVHHMMAYVCPEYLVTDSSHIGYEGVCDEWDTNMPSKNCRHQRVAYGWAVGGNDLFMPKKAGMALSGDSGFHYVFVITHYDNPLERTDIVDSSGFRMYITPTLREYDVGVMMIGTDTTYLGQYIPHGLENAHNVAIMSDKCTQNTVPEEGIYVFGSLLHQHTIGKASTFRHIRNGKELPPIDSNLNYDFNYQQTIIFDEPKEILPGDSFIVDCWTDSRERTNVTIGGESSRDEMCLEFLFYYPEIEIKLAATWKETYALKAWLMDAQIAGYLSGDESDIESIFNKQKDISSLTYYSEKDGALEFYNRLSSADYDKYNKHKLFCTSDENVAGIVNSDFSNAPIPNGFELYDMDIFSCDNVGVDTTIIGECLSLDSTDNAQLIKGYISILLSIIIIIYY